MKKIQLAFVTSGELPMPPIKGGAVEGLVYNFILENEKRKKFDIHVYCTSNDNEEFECCKIINCKSFIQELYLKINPKYRNKLSLNPYLMTVNKRIKKEGKHYDYIIVENRYNYKILSNEYTKVILHMHNSHLIPKTKVKERLLANYDGIYCISKFIEKEIKEQYSGINTNTSVWYNGIDVNKFSRVIDSERLLSLRKKLGIFKNDFVIVYAGRIIEEKGVRELIQGFNLFRETTKNAKLVIIGSSWYASGKKDSPFIRELKTLSSKYSEDIIFTGFVENDKLPEYLHIANVLAFPSIWNEPFGLTVVEGLSTGKPTISIDSGAIAEIYEKCDPRTKLFLIHKDIEGNIDIPKEMCERMEIVKDNPNLYSCIDGQISAMNDFFSIEAFYRNALGLFK